MDNKRGAPFFSIILPTFNRAHLIETAVKSVVNQDFMDWELIIVDDGSTDNTREIISSYTDQRIRYFYQENAERSMARNNGIDFARGEYVCFLDSDDYYTHERLTNLYKKILSHPMAFYYTGLILKTVGGNEIIMKAPNPIYNKYENILLSIIHSQETCISAQILKKFKFDKRFHIGEDTELWLRIADEYEPLYLVDCCDVVICDHEERSVSIKKQNSALDHLKTLKHIFKNNHSLKKISPKIRRSTFSDCYFNIAKHYIFNNATYKSIIYLVQSIIEQPSNKQTKFKVNLILNLLLRPSNTIKLIASS